MLIFPLSTFITPPCATFMQIKYNGVYNTTSSDSCKLEKDVPSLGASQVVLMVKNPPASAEDIRNVGSISGLGRFPWRRAWQPTPVFLPGESHGQRSLAGYSPWGRKELDTTEQLTHPKISQRSQKRTEGLPRT